jgi:branched-chain amino acid transport system substrate-binding protein
MKRQVWLVAAASAALVFSTAAPAAETVKVGVIGPFSGQLSGSWGTPFRQGMETYTAQKGALTGDIKIEYIYRDLPTVDPQRARALAQELIVRDKVQYLAGFVSTPDALAVANVIQSAKIPSVIFNAAGPTIVAKSDYFLRTSNTLPEITVPVAKYMAENGLKRVVTAVADYSPGADAEAAFKEAYGNSGQVIESIRMPLSTTDFGPFLQKIRLLKPDALFVFLPAGPATFGFVKAYQENGMKAEGIRFFGLSETQESDLQQLGDAAIGLETSYIYSAAHESKVNTDFQAAYRKLYPNGTVNPATVMAYDGTHVLRTMIEATKGKKDADGAMKAAKGLAWESPRGPVRIDPTSRELVQNVYIRSVQKGPDGRLYNKEIKVYPPAAKP